MSSCCESKNAMCAWTDSLAPARICKQWWVCSSVLVLSQDIKRRWTRWGKRRGTGRGMPAINGPNRRGKPTLNGPATLSTCEGLAEIGGGGTSTLDLGG